MALLAANAPASGQIVGSAGGARVRSVEYRGDQVVPLRAAPSQQVTVRLASDEHIQTVALDDPGAWQASAVRGDNVVVVKSAIAGGATGMTVVTDVRTYSFDLAESSAAAEDLPDTLRFTYPAPVGAAGPDVSTEVLAEPMTGRYRLRGDRSLYPAAISDDGTRTFIDWPPAGPLPAVYSREEDGRETLLNGNMRGRFFVIDEIVPQLVFRIDKRRARADREVAGGRS